MFWLSLSTMMGTFGFMFFLFSSPHLMLVFLSLETLLMSVFLGISSVSLWLSYFLFVMILGGLVVIFAYISILCPGDLYEVFPWFFGGLFMMISAASSYLNYKGYLVQCVSTGWSYLNNFWYQVSMLFSFSHLLMYGFFAVYLLLVLVFVVSFMKIYKGPLRFFSGS